jgi:hypothetical protein
MVSGNTPVPRAKGTRLVARIAKPNRKQKRAPRVRLGAPDGRITPRAGLHLVAKLDQLLGISRTIDAGSPRIKERRRGLGMGKLVVSLAETVLSGGDFLVDLDYQRKDAAGLALRAVPDVPASTTVISLGKRFSAEARKGVEQANAALVAKAFALLPKPRRDELSSRRPTIDLDPTDVEVYGAKKQGCAYNYAGQRTYRPHPAAWAETGWALAAELGSGKSDPRPQAPGLIARAVAALPEGLPRPIVRGDSGFFSKDVAWAALANGADFAIAVKRTDPVWRSLRKVPETGWRKATGMEAEVAECDYVPAGWPPGTRTICRRVMLNPEEVSRDARSRRRRTIDPEQLALFEAGEIGPVYAYSFIITNLDWDICEIEAWFRERALVEETIKDSKYGAALRHMPSGYEAVNALWMWSALIAMNISSWLQALTRHDKRSGRAHGKRLRRELVCVAARVTRHAGRLIVHPSPEDANGAFGSAWRALDTLLAATSP